MSRESPLFSRKIMKATGEFEEVVIGRPAVTVVLLLIVAILIVVFTLLGIDPTLFLKGISQFSTRETLLSFLSS